MKNAKEIVKIDYNFPLFEDDNDPTEILHALNENIDGGLRVWNLDTVKIPTGGSLYWTVPSLEEPEGEQKKELIGVCVGWKYSRIYYSRPMDEGGERTRPDCRSHDSKVGVGNPGGLCAECPFGQWVGSDKPACKLQIEVMLMTEGNVLPTAVILSPASIKSWKDFLLALGKRAIPYYGAVIKLGLEVAKTPSGIKYSKVLPAFLQKIDPDQTRKMQVMRDQLMPYLMQQPVNEIYGETWSEVAKGNTDVTQQTLPDSDDEVKVLTPGQAKTLVKLLTSYGYEADELYGEATEVLERIVNSFDGMEVSEARRVKENLVKQQQFRLIAKIKNAGLPTSKHPELFTAIAGREVNSAFDLDADEFNQVAVALETVLEHENTWAELLGEEESLPI